MFGAASPPPTPDQFSALAGKSEEFFTKGQQHFESEEYREALNAFEQARIFSTEPDPRIEEMIQRARAALNPSPTPTNTLTPTVTPTPRPPVRMSTQPPDEELANAYFGTTYLTVVPGQESLPPPITLFWSEYQIGLYVEKLGQSLRQPFTLRVFDLANGQLVGEAKTETPTSEPSARPPDSSGIMPPAQTTPGQDSPPVNGPGAAAHTGQTGQIKQWFDRFVWYQEGGERPGRYRLELFAGSILARVLEYEVQAAFVPLPTPTSTPTLTPTPSPTPTVTPAIIPTPSQVAPGQQAPGQVAPDAAATPVDTPTPLPTSTPTPAVASVAVTGGLPAGIAFNPAIGRLYVADASGVIWMVDQNGPLLNQPFVVESPPVDVAVDPLTGRLYVALKGSGAETIIAVLHGTSGERLGSITVPNGQVTELAINPGVGLLYALVPSAEQLSIVDLRRNAVAQSIRFGPLAHVTGMALDPGGTRLFMSDLTGQLLVFDAHEPRSAQQIHVSGPGLAGLTALDRHVFAFNTPGKKVYVVNVDDLRVEREVALQQEPGAIAANQQSGMVYVLGTQRPALIRVDPFQGQVTGTAFLPDRSGRMSLQPGVQRDLTGLRSRIAVNQFDGSMYITQPEIGTVSVVTQDMFPATAGGGQ